MDVYSITQTGRVLSSAPIKINKYDNRTIKLQFDLDNSIDGRMLFFAMLNPITDEYQYFPITDGSLLLGNSVSRYPGKWSCILMATNDYVLDEITDIDETKVTWVSNTFNKIIVVDNFLDDDAYEGEISYPAYEQAAQYYKIEADNIAAIATTCDSDKEECQRILTSCRELYTQMQQLYNQMIELYERMSG